MSADMILTVADAPVYLSTPENQFPTVITDHEVLITRATDKVLDDLGKLIRSREDGELRLFEEALNEDQLDVFEEDFDGDADITTKRRELALVALKHILNEIFPSIGGFGEGSPELSREVTWLWVTVGGTRKTLLVTGGLSHGDSATEAMPALTVLDALNLFEEPFLRPGEEAPAPARTLSSEELVEFNDFLTEQLAIRGWNADSEDDYDALNDLTLELAPLQVQVDDLLAKFLADNSRG